MCQQESQESLSNLSGNCAPRAQNFDSKHHGIKSDSGTTNLPVLLIPRGSKSPSLGVLTSQRFLAFSSGNKNSVH